MILVARTQIMENYGAHHWDRQGECPQYWKAKGGSEYKIINLPKGVEHTEIIMAVRGDIEVNNEFYTENIIDWSIESDDYLSWFEKSQLEYDGSIMFKEPVIDFAEVEA